MALRLSAALLAVVASPQSPPAHDQYAVAQTMIAPGAVSQSRAVALMVGRIVSFAQWPMPLASVRLCVVGATRFADRLDAIGAEASPRIETRIVGPDQAPAGCDAVYVGALPYDAHQRLIAAVHDKPVLTIAEQDATCRGGTMFCLAVTSTTLSFQINVDAISRSRVAVDPRVLRLSDADRGAR